MRYRVTGPTGYTVTDLKTIQDWILQRRLKAVPGVVDVTGWGGKTKTYEVTIDQNKLTSYGLTIPQVLQALNNANINVGGQTVNFGPQAAVVRGVGLIHSMDDIRKTVLTSVGNSPVLVQDVAEVSVGNKPRLGIAGHEADDDVVQGIVLMRRGEQSTPTIKAVEAEIEKINTTEILPPGVQIQRIYDRSDLIAITTQTVLHNMLVGIVLIFCVQWLFLGNFRSAIIVATSIPFALFFAVLIMLAMGESANLLSVGAIDFGLIVDATVIMVENIFRHMAEAQHKRPAGNPLLLRQIFSNPAPAFHAHRQCRWRSEPIDLFLGGDHHRGLCAAVYAVRRGRPHLWPDGEDLRLRACGRFDRHLHHFARAMRLVPSRPCRGGRNRDRPLPQSRLPPASQLRFV